MGKWKKICTLFKNKGVGAECSTSKTRGCAEYWKCWQFFVVELGPKIFWKFSNIIYIFLFMILNHHIFFIRWYLPIVSEDTWNRDKRWPNFNSNVKYWHWHVIFNEFCDTRIRWQSCCIESCHPGKCQTSWQYIFFAFVPEQQLCDCRM